jgi:hypothetical protein
MVFIERGKDRREVQQRKTQIPTDMNRRKDERRSGKDRREE